MREIPIDETLEKMKRWECGSWTAGVEYYADIFDVALGVARIVDEPLIKT